MQVDVNGQGVTVQAVTLADLLTEQGFEAAAVATAVNGQFVPRPSRANHTLSDGDRIEVLSPMQGG
ncbi:sulfur carrier protein ThiS [Thalassovita mediterranea]|jgi:sulfur carrier protein|uniref:Sulfur carrier protein ThiS n=1 Tax=Thalassovita mediterranea TaxID=340021 RepID=A0A0P1GNW0_9RHOB|nr:sulfur carrier protein ThiS [Thalassovita mediterranea]CUH84182.1 sulfur carrier protein ThiS [Thalassovita mediterranea]SIS27597.1 sulfur carrier protein [Thalassovita mediterranea]